MATNQNFALGGAIDDTDDTGDTGGIGDGGALGGDENQDDTTSKISSALKTVNEALTFGRSQFGIGGQKQAGNIPARPAGPGGDKPDDNPFPTKTTSPPFGRRPLRIGAIDDDTTQSFAEGGTVEDPLTDAGDPLEDARKDTYNTGEETTGDVNRNKTRLQIRMEQQGQGVTDEGVEAQNAIPEKPDEAKAREQGPIAAAGMAPHQLLQQGFQRLIGYVSGAGAAPPDQVKSAEAEVDPQGMLDEDTRKLLAVDAAGKQGGAAAAFKMVQHYRTKYDAYKNFAAAALNGTPEKPSDLAAAAQAATQAYPNMLDGSKVVFQPAQNGVTAAVTTSDGKQMQIPLTVPQFNEFLRGNSGQYDNVVENGGVKVLQQVAQGEGRPVGPPQGQAQQPSPGVLQRPNMQQRPAQPPAAQNQSAWQPFAGVRPQAKPAAPAKARQEDEDIDPQIIRQANRLFPRVSQEAERSKYIMDQLGGRMERTNKVEVAKAQGVERRAVAEIQGGARVKSAEARAGSVTDAARIRADSYKDVANVREAGRNEVARTHLQGVLAGIAQTAQNAQQRSAATIAAKQVANVPLGQDIPPETAAFISQLMGGGSGAPQPPQPRAASPQAPQPRAPQAPQAAPPGQKWYLNPKTGERKLGPA